MTDPRHLQDPENAIRAIYSFAAREMRKGASNPEVHTALVERGLDSDSAATVIFELDKARSEAMQSAGKRDMLIGGIILLIGLIVTCGSLANGGGYVIAYGAVIIGLLRFSYGLKQSMS